MSLTDKQAAAKQLKEAVDALLAEHQQEALRAFGDAIKELAESLAESLEITSSTAAASPGKPQVTLHVPYSLHNHPLARGRHRFWVEHNGVFKKFTAEFKVVSGISGVSGVHNIFNPKHYISIHGWSPIGLPGMPDAGTSNPFVDNVVSLDVLCRKALKCFGLDYDGHADMVEVVYAPSRFHPPAGSVYKRG